MRAAYSNILLKSARFPQGREKDCSPRRPLHISRPVLRKKDVIEPFNILITGGGTGGHLFPGIAIAESFLEKNPKNRILFVLTGNPFEKKVLREKNFTFETVTASGIKGMSALKKLKSISSIPRGIFESRKIIKRFKPDLAIGMGSYSSGPVLMAAWLSGIKIVLHEQNIKPGITNRFLSGFAKRVYVSFRHTNTGIARSKVRFTGNPVRQNILECSKSHKKTDRMDDTSKFTVLVLGGSQGAHSINMAVAEALAFLKNPNDFIFIHQTGQKDEHEIKKTYKRIGVDSIVEAFFDNMGSIYQKADLIICRAGATTVAEVTAMGKCSIFIPYPHAADDHQTLNAKSVTDADAAEIILESALSGKALAEKIEALATDPVKRKTMAENSKSIGNPDAALTIINDCYQLLLNENRKKEYQFS
jgi:UDP-N-acetylglucosamine--N-acetylmuramyl-(pentapeptide) pyrophosphoryl-undecaprenol N-acetylglucosamine transferase